MKCEKGNVPIAHKSTQKGKKMIEVKSVKKKFVRQKNKKEKEEFYANYDISFEVKEGEILGLLRTKWSRKNDSFENDGRNFRTNRRGNLF